MDDNLNIHFIHVGHMANKGTQGLFISDVNIIKELIGKNVSISVSTTDIEGVDNLNLPLDEIHSSILDVPYEKADELGGKIGFTRNDVKYKFVTVYYFIALIFQSFLSIISAIMIKVGFKGIYRNELLNRIKKSDLIISGSDEIYKETASLLSFNIIWMITWWSLLFTKAWDVLIAKFFGRNIIMFPNSVGPFRTIVGKSLIKTSLNNYDYIFVRENISFGIVESLKLKCKSILTSDSAILLPLKENCLYDIVKNSIGVCPGVYAGGIPDKKLNIYINAHAEALDDAIERYDVTVYFLPHYIRGFEFDDLDTCNKIMSTMKNKSKAKLIIIDNVADFKCVLNKMEVVISSKMHPAVFSTSEGTPTVCIAYDHKQIGFFDVIGMPDCLISIQDVNYARLWNNLVHVYENRAIIRDKLNNIMVNMKIDQKNAIGAVLSNYVNDQKCAD